MNPRVIITILQKGAKPIVAAAGAVAIYVFGRIHGVAEGETKGVKKGYQKASEEYEKALEKLERLHKEKDAEFYEQLKKLKEEYGVH